MVKIKDKRSNGENIGFEEKLWQAADKLRNNMDASEYKYVVLGLIFLKYISDAFKGQHVFLIRDPASGADPEDPDGCRAATVFRVPKEVRWNHLWNAAKQPDIGKLINNAMDAVEKDNPILKGVLPTNYTRPALDKQRFQFYTPKSIVRVLVEMIEPYIGRRILQGWDLRFRI